MKRWRIISTVNSIRERCPAHEFGNKIAHESSEMRLNETDRVCLNAMPCMIHFLYALTKGVSIREMGLGKTEEKAYIQCPDRSPPYTSGETVMSEIRREVIKK